MRSIMIVDDEPIVCDGIEQIVRTAMPSLRPIYKAYDGVEALMKIGDQPPSIVLCDINMPRMDGIALSRELVQRFPQIVVIFLTGHDDFAYAQMSVRNHVFDYLLKPVDDEKLVLCLQQAEKEVERRRQEAFRSQLLDMHFSGKLSRLYEIVMSNQLLLALDAGDRPMVEQLVESLFDQIDKVTERKEQQEEVASGLYSLLISSFSERFGPPPESLIRLDTAGFQGADGLSRRFLYQLGELMQYHAAHKLGNHKITLIKRHICRHFQEDLSLQSIADLFQMNPSYLSDLFKEQTGQNFRSYLIEVRMEHAIELLKKPEIRIHQVAEQVGYPDYAYFNKLFKKLTGLTPGAFRRLLGEHSDPE